MDKKIELSTSVIDKDEVIKTAVSAVFLIAQTQDDERVVTRSIIENILFNFLVFYVKPDCYSDAIIDIVGTVRKTIEKYEAEQS